jgi:hypothetical protein
MSRATRRWWSMICTALLPAAACLVASPAEAGTTPPACAVGAITEFGGGLSTAGNPTASITGWMLPCPTVVLPDSYAIVYFTKTVGTVTPSRRRAFASVTGKSMFATTATYSTYRSSSGAAITEELPLAICAALRDMTLVDCVQVGFLGAGQPPLMHRIPITDPVVRKPTIFINQEETDNGCGNCV